VAVGSFEAPCVVIVLFGHPVPRVAEDEGSIADVLGIVEGDRGRDAVPKQMRRHAAAESVLGVFDDPVRQRSLLDLGSNLRRAVCGITDTFSPKENRPMHIEIAFSLGASVDGTLAS
jgi:hypothetical protein